MNIYSHPIDEVFESLKTMEFHIKDYHSLEKYEQVGYEHSEETKKAISNSLKGNTNKAGKTGYKLSDEFREKCKVRLTKDNPAKNPKVKEKLRNIALLKPKLKCPHCDSTGDPGNIKRWHFDNCKQK